MKLFCFPKKQTLFLIYSSFGSFRSDFFKHLYIQSSPKDSLFFRLLKTKLGFIINYFIRYELEVPNSEDEYLGIVKGEKRVLFELLNNIPVKVWRQDKNLSWVDEPFLGYQLITEYTLREIRLKQAIIKTALKIHWGSVNETLDNIHGDLTHFNILIAENQKIHFIDRKVITNSKLFDFFYFYAYLKQSIVRCSSLKANHKSQIISIIETIIIKVCKYESFLVFRNDFEQIDIPKSCGLLEKNKTQYLKDFFNMFEDQALG